VRRCSTSATSTDAGLICGLRSAGATWEGIVAKFKYAPYGSENALVKIKNPGKPGYVAIR
jgi:hypothetical protein